MAVVDHIDSGTGTKSDVDICSSNIGREMDACPTVFDMECQTVELSCPGKKSRLSTMSISEYRKPCAVEWKCGSNESIV